MKSSSFTASAPGRLDVMGGIADYSGSLVLQMPIRESNTVTVAFRNDTRFRVSSEAAAQSGWTGLVDWDLKQLPPLRGRIHWTRLRAALVRSPEEAWASYVLGCWILLHLEKGAPLVGMDARIRSRVPMGKGVSSSASLEVAAMAAMARAYRLPMALTELPILCQQVENRIVGAPCGLMDQLSCYLGRKDHLLPILCQPDQVRPPLPLPPRMHFLGLDSGVRHAVSGASYTDVRTAAFMAYTIIARHLGTSRGTIRQAHRTGRWSDLPFQGYLANIPLSVFEQHYRSLLPPQITGRAFQQRYGAIIDSVTQVQPDTEYRPLACGEHPIREMFRVQSFCQLLKALSRGGLSESDTVELYRQLGELMYQSHAGYSRCGLGCDATDQLVDLVRARGPKHNLYGAKITGGGSGGTVCVLARGRAGRDSARRLFQDYCRKTKMPLLFLSGSSEGARYRKANPL